MGNQNIIEFDQRVSACKNKNELIQESLKYFVEKFGVDTAFFYKAGDLSYCYSKDSGPFRMDVRGDIVESIKQSCIEQYVLFNIEDLFTLALGNKNREVRDLKEGCLYDDLLAIVHNLSLHVKYLGHIENSVSKDTCDKLTVLLNNVKQALFMIDSKGMVIPPVSSFSKNIFNIDINSINVFSFLFKSLDDIDKHNILSVFGSDKIEWALLEEELPKKIIYWDLPKNSDSVKTLKITYNPIWGQSQSLEKLMLVVEDISDIEKLECEIQKEKKKSSDKMLILQELALLDPKNLRHLFNSIFLLLDSSFKILKQINLNRSLIGELFRNLHTIKGNARMYGLSRLSTITNDVESNLMLIRPYIDSPDYNFLEKVKDLQSGLENISYCTQEYFEYAEKLFKIQNEFRSKNIFDIHRFVVFLEICLNYFLDKKDSRFKYFMEDILKKLEDSCRQTFKDNDFYHAVIDLNCLIHGPSSEKKNEIEDYLFVIENHAKYLYTRSQLFRPYSLDTDTWGAMCFALYELSMNLMEDSSLGDSYRDTLVHYVGEVMNFSNKGNFVYVEYLVKFCYEIITNNNFMIGDVCSVLKDSIRNIWHYISLINKINSLNLLSQDSREILLNTIYSLENDFEKNRSVISSSVGNGTLIFSTLSIFNEKNISPISFFDCYSKIVENKKSDRYTVLNFVSLQENIPFNIEKMYHIVLNGEISENTVENVQLMLASLSSPIANDFTKNILSLSNYLLFTDLGQFLANYINTEDLLLSRGHKFVEVIDSNVNKLKEFINIELSKIPNFKGLIKLKELSDRLFDLPLKPALARFFPMVRELSDRLGKKICFKIDGSDCLLHPDKMMLINDSLVHLIRNAIDHGIEAASIRQKLLKDEVGTIRVVIADDESTLTLRISDDGQGMDSDKLKERALKNALISFEDLNKMVNPLDLIFISGFSSKDVVTDLSGRGVGLDIVKTNIEQMGGTVLVETLLGKGTIFTLKIPLT